MAFVSGSMSIAAQTHCHRPPPFGCHHRCTRAPGKTVRACVASVPSELPWHLRGVNFCTECGSSLKLETSPGDTAVRPVCIACRKPVYINPKNVCGAVVVTQDRQRVLLGQRSIPPFIGKWTYPSGFMEIGENTKQGAEREALEETMASIKCTKLLAVYNIPAIAQVHVVYMAELQQGSEIGAGAESMAAGLFSWDQIPWDELAFPTTKWALEYAYSSLHLDTFEPQLRTKLEDGSFVENS